MTNLSGISFRELKLDIKRRRNNVRKSLDALEYKDSTYAEHHQHLINVYTEIMNTIERGLIDSEEVGEGYE